MELLKLRKKPRKVNQKRLEREALLKRQARNRTIRAWCDKKFGQLFKLILFGIALVYCFLMWAKSFVWNNPPCTWFKTFFAVVYDTMEIWYARITNIDTPEESERRPTDFDFMDDEDVI